MKTFRLILVVLFIIAIGFAAWEVIVKEPNAGVNERELVQEFNEIKHPTGSKQISFSSSHKTSQAIAVAKYESSLKYEELVNIH